MKDFFKIYRNQFVVAIVSVALTSLVVSSVNKKSENENNYVQIQVINGSTIGENNMINQEVISDGNADECISGYIQDLRDEYNDVKEDSGKKGLFIDKLKRLVNFVSGDGEINGYTFDDLTGTGKEGVLSSLYDFDLIINEFIPDYKSRFKTWLSNKEEKLEVYYDNLKSKWNEYKESDIKVFTK